MAGSGAGWPSLDASWGISLEMASCTGADAEYGVMTFVVFGLYTNTVASFGVFVQFANSYLQHAFFIKRFLFSFGVFLPYFKDHFNAGSGEISTVNSIQMGVTFASGNLMIMIIQIWFTFASGNYILMIIIKIGVTFNRQWFLYMFT